MLKCICSNTVGLFTYFVFQAVLQDYLYFCYPEMYVKLYVNVGKAVMQVQV
jgi:hypothetical protein